MRHEALESAERALRQSERLLGQSRFKQAHLWTTQAYACLALAVQAKDVDWARKIEEAAREARQRPVVKHEPDIWLNRRRPAWEAAEDLWGRMQEIITSDGAWPGGDLVPIVDQWLRDHGIDSKEEVPDGR